MPTHHSFPFSRVLPQAVLPGLGSRAYREIKASAFAFCSAQLAYIRPRTSLIPRRPLGLWKNGCGWRSWQSARQRRSESPPTRVLPSMVDQPATPGGLCCSELAWEFGRSLLGSPWEPQGLGGCQQCVGVRWQEHPILPYVGRLALEWEGNHLFFPFRWMVLLPPPQGRAARLGRAGRGPGPRKPRDPLSPPISLAWHLRGTQHHRSPHSLYPTIFSPCRLLRKGA